MSPGPSNRRGAPRALLVALVLLGTATAALAGAPLTIGSKAFPESWILGEALAHLARDARLAPVEHRSNLGGTEIVWASLTSGAVDVYPEYTGTISEVILKRPGRATHEELRAALAVSGVGLSEPLGFNDGYALAMTRERAQGLAIRTISDLSRHRALKLGLTHEFLGRADGWPGLARHYGLDLPDVRGIQHELAYTAIASGQVDAIDIYTTDAQIEHLKLAVLEDDRGFFPRYDAVWLYRLDLAERHPKALEAMARFEGRIDEPTMTRANARVVLDHEPFAAAAEALLEDALGRDAARGATTSRTTAILRDTARHLRLVAISMLFAVCVGVPLGVLASRSRALASAILAAAGIVQTVPSLALLAFLIPLLGIGAAPALVALFLYSLLPIVRNTYLGITSIPPPLAESAQALGLSPRARLLRVELPMAAPAILAGAKTSAVINVGVATLAALVGAGGLGDPILAGIQLRRNDLILQGAIPAAVLALAVQWAFGILDRVLVPRGLRAPEARR